MLGLITTIHIAICILLIILEITSGVSFTIIALGIISHITWFYLVMKILEQLEGQDNHREWEYKKK